MTPNQRTAFAALMTEIRNSRFQGNRKAAYTAAQVNSATWTRVEEGLSIKEGSIAKIVGNLLPTSGGDWQKLLDADGNFHLNYWDRNELASTDAGDIERVLGVSEWSGANDVQDLPGANQALREVRTRLARIEYRLERLEEHLEFDPFAEWSITQIDGRPNTFVVPEDVADEAVAALDDQENPPGAPEGPST